MILDHLSVLRVYSLHYRAYVSHNQIYLEGFATLDKTCCAARVTSRSSRHCQNGGSAVPDSKITLEALQGIDAILSSQR